MRIYSKEQVMNNEIPLMMLRNRLCRECLDDMGEDSDHNRKVLVCEAKSWSDRGGYPFPWADRANPEWGALDNLNIILDARRGTKRDFIDYWSAFLDSRSVGTPSADVTLESSLRTTELALAAVLSLQGFDSGMELISERRVAWHFAPATREEQSRLGESVQQFRDGTCRVDPRRFVQELAQVRRRLYDFLGSSASRAA